MSPLRHAGPSLCPGCGKLVGINDSRCGTCGRWNPTLWGFAPWLRILGRDLGFVQIVLYGCSFLYVACLLMDAGNVRVPARLSFLSPSLRSLYMFGASGAVPVFGRGRWWTVLSAGWLHGGLLHILFNMMWVRQLGPAVGDLFGTSRMVILYTAASATGFLLSSVAGAFLGSLPLLGGAGFTVGASAPIFGLLAALVFYGRNVGGRALGAQAWTYAVILFVFGFVMPGVDNYAHAGGFLGGYAAARWLNPHEPERGDHAILALACVAATALAIVASVVLGLRDFLAGT
ncbi:MAG: rhomboid family intramembrane serine protease [Acidobacteria bacterium]|nr:rhomboid family intramembrane serine protease [Acidobacteriota bacterium]